MSLQLAAQHLAAKGRGPDTTLVHMAPQEVAGLQALARAHGGTLTTNPDTGLPEAGFLSSILPMIAGVALGPAGLGLTAMQAALATGAVGTLATGSLRKGLMAGLGAYGGAGIGGVIGNAGAAAIEGAVPSVAGAAPVAVVPPPTAVAPAATAATVPAEYASFAPTATNYGAFGEAPTMAAPAVQVAPIATATPQPYQGINPAATNADYVNQMDLADAAGAPRAAALREAGPMGRFTRGLQEVAKNPKQLLTKENMRYGLAALAPFMMQEQSGQAYPGSGPNPYQFRFNPGRATNPQRAGGVGEYQFFNPSYQRYADGGPIQAMSDRNDQEMFMANGGQRFADGGSTSDNVYNYIYDPVTRTYKQPGQIAATARTPDTSRYVTKDVTRDVGTNSQEEIAAQGAWGNLSPLQQAEYYASHPVQAAVTQTGQNVFGFTSLGALQNAMVPDFVSLQHSIPDMTGTGLLAQVQNTENFHDAMMGVPITIANYGATGPNVGGWGSNVNVGQQVTPSAQSLSLSGGLIPALIGQQNPAPVEDAVPTISNEQAALQAAQEYNAALEAAAAASYGSQGETAPGGIGFGSDIGFDSGPVGGVDGGVGAADGGGGAADGGGGAVGDGDGGGGPGSAGWARGGLSSLTRRYAYGGMSHLGDYSDGGRLLKGPGDGVSDSIPAVIGNKRPARLADGEFVVPARIVSELGNGSTEAGARKLYAMMDRIQKSRGKTVGKGKVAVNSRADKHLPA